MLDRFTDNARRAIFYARGEAAERGSEEIETDHLLYGVLKTDRALLEKLGISLDALQKLGSSFAKRDRGRPVSPPGIPLSIESRNAISQSAKVADHQGTPQIGVSQFLAGLLAGAPRLRKALTDAGAKPEAIDAATSHTEPAFEQQVPTGWEMAQSRFCSGIGYDLHRLEAGRKLMIGGVEIPFDKGSVGHSDGDVLAHAICDALLGAATLGDIGTHFPDTDPRWKGASSLLFLEHIATMLAEHLTMISHIDAVVICERPKLGPHFPAMKRALAKALKIDPAQINLKAKTNEGMDAIGRGEALAAQAVATILQT
jgi:2-C-methyl-D-erythritol 2,4-cyclodiphosphate synthase